METQITLPKQELTLPESSSQFPTLLSVRQFSEKHPAFSQGSLRNLIFNATNRKTTRGDIQGNGLDVALVRIGKKLLIDEIKFYQWVNEQQGNK